MSAQYAVLLLCLVLLCGVALLGLLWVAFEIVAAHREIAANNRERLRRFEQREVEIPEQTQVVDPNDS